MVASAGSDGGRFADDAVVQLRVRIRECREEDLEALEWFGAYRLHRGIARRTFEEQRCGRALMLVLEANGHASGQAWIDFGRRRGVIWAVRVLPCLQNLGLGSRLAGACEARLVARGVAEAEVSVERGNAGALRFWEGRGYRTVGEHRWVELLGDGGDGGAAMRLDQWVLRRGLTHDGAGGSDGAGGLGRRDRADRDSLDDRQREPTRI
jgi:ribosomal protein S18 acetylase RimI-like enzyme